MRVKNRTMLKIIFAVLLVSSAAGIAAQDWQQDVKAISTEFDSSVALRGKELSDASNPMSTKSWYLVSSVDKKTKAATTYLQFAVIYSAPTWQTWRNASSSEGQRLDVLPIKKGTLDCQRNCTFYEQVAVELSREMLGKAAADGVRIRFQSTSGAEHIVSLSGPMVSSQVAAIADTTARLP